MGNYDNITDAEFDREIIRLAQENIGETVSIDGVYEIISEHYNNEALENIMKDKRDKRRARLMKVLTTPAWQL